MVCLRVVCRGGILSTNRYATALSGIIRRNPTEPNGAMAVEIDRNGFPVPRALFAPAGVKSSLWTGRWGGNMGYVDQADHSQLVLVRNVCQTNSHSGDVLAQPQERGAISRNEDWKRKG
jgi:hypothetical protein